MEKSKFHYPWWGYIKAIIRAYPEQMGTDLSGIEKRNFEAVQAAIEATGRMADGESRLKVIRLVHWKRTHQLGGAALAVPCGRRTAAYWQRQFFEMVAQNRGLLDEDSAENGTGWISVEKQLPDCGEVVLTFSPNNGICMGFVHEGGRFTVYMDYPSRPTHWMPLPKTPAWKD